jgi:phytanoyl-CoA hydroxylase
MIGLFLQPNAAEVIGMSPYDSNVKAHALAVIEDGYTVIKNGISEELCRETIAAFRRFECANEEIFAENRDANGHYPRIVNLHSVLPELVSLFTQNSVWLQVQDVLFGAPTALYTSLFYEVGSQQPLHRDTPVFATRPEYLYFGTTVYLEPAGDENGCLEVLEGGHKIPELDREAMALRRYRSLDNIPAIDGDIWNEYQDEVTALGLSRGLGIKKPDMAPPTPPRWIADQGHASDEIFTRYSQYSGRRSGLSSKCVFQPKQTILGKSSMGLSHGRRAQDF